MKVVLFCGGLGTRLRDYSETIPKPMVPIGSRPLLWNIMKYYAHFGHTDFILALGYKSSAIKEFFLNYKEEITNDFVYSKGGKRIELLNTDIQNWKITFVETGLHANVGTRLWRLKEYLKDEEVFLANYSDGLTDMNLNDMLTQFYNYDDKVASFMTCKPKSSLHSVKVDNEGIVKDIRMFSYENNWINAGFFILRNEIFDVMNEGEELVLEPFQRLISQNKLLSYKYKGFWQAMDTFKDKMILDKMKEAGNPPWEIWNHKFD